MGSTETGECRSLRPLCIVFFSYRLDCLGSVFVFLCVSVFKPLTVIWWSSVQPDFGIALILQMVEGGYILKAEKCVILLIVAPKIQRR